MILRDAAADLTKQTLMNMYDTITSTQFNSILINLDAPNKYTRYLKNFMETINPDDYNIVDKKLKTEK